MADVLLLQRPVTPFTTAPGYATVVPGLGATGSSAKTFNATVADDNNYLTVSYQIGGLATPASSVTYNGVQMQSLGLAYGTGGIGFVNHMWGLKNPAKGTNQVVITAPGGVSQSGYMCFKNVGTVPNPANAVLAGGTGSTTINIGPITGRAGDMLVGAIGAGGTVIAGTGETEAWNDGSGESMLARTCDGTAQNVTWTAAGGPNFVAVAVLLPAAVPGTTDVILTGPENYESDVWLGQSFNTATAGLVDVYLHAVYTAFAPAAVVVSGLSASLTDTALSFSDTVAVTRFLSFAETDSGLNSFSDTLTHLVLRVITDTAISSFSDSEPSHPTRVFSDTALTFSDTVVETKFLIKSETDTALTFSDTELRQPVLRVATDTALTFSDSDAITRGFLKNETDTAISSFSDSVLRQPVLRVDTDTALGFSDSVAAKRFLSFAETDTALSFSDSVLYFIVRPDSDTALNFSDAVARTAFLHFAETDTALSLSETLVHTVGRVPSDTALSVSDALTRALQRTLADTALSFSDSDTETKFLHLAVTDTALSFSHSVVATKSSSSSTTVTPSDNALSSFSDTTILDTTRPPSDSGLSFSDTLVRFLTRPESDNAISFSDLCGLTSTRPPVDIGISFSDTVAEAVLYRRADAGTGADTSHSYRFVVDTGLDSEASTLRAVYVRSDTGTDTEHATVAANIDAATVIGKGVITSTDHHFIDEDGVFPPKEIYTISDGKLHFWVSGKGKSAVYL